MYYLEVKLIPAQTAKIPRMQLSKMYSIAILICPLVINCNVSLEKVEKVVKPPQKPVINNSFKLVFSTGKNPANMPIKKQPIKFMLNVARGNVEV